MTKLEEKLYIIIDIRNDRLMWYGTKKDCKWWISKSNPYNKQFYKIFRTIVDFKVSNND